mmetsp:Transcript_5628/g.13040  ORF Transcript_5628/g.13040 Transcript_5628/m.13040 type:complete len:265 (+) Transcript_5628:265-1059(+)
MPTRARTRTRVHARAHAHTHTFLCERRKRGPFSLPGLPVGGEPLLRGRHVQARGRARPFLWRERRVRLQPGQLRRDQRGLGEWRRFEAVRTRGKQRRPEQAQRRAVLADQPLRRPLLGARHRAQRHGASRIRLGDCHWRPAYREVRRRLYDERERHQQCRALALHARACRFAGSHQRDARPADHARHRRLPPQGRGASGLHVRGVHAQALIGSPLQVRGFHMLNTSVDIWTPLRARGRKNTAFPRRRRSQSDGIRCVGCTTYGL